jgi:hypothetical protein
MGGDGSGNGFAKDAFGYTLRYNKNDYQAIGGSSSQAFLDAVSTGNLSTNLYNGNIARMATALSEKVQNNDLLNLGTQVRDFRYDELNRLVKSDKISGKGVSDAYATTYSYDANGNIDNLTRRDGEGLLMDDLTYRYAEDGAGKRLNNRLLHVNDYASEGSEVDTDLKDQGTFVQNNNSTHNYGYDKIGNLIRDNQEEIAEIVWNVQGKVQEIRRTANSKKPDLLFKYDAMGNRVSKTIRYKNPNPEGIVTVEQTTYYVRDAQGNVMAVYEWKHDAVYSLFNGSMTVMSNVREMRLKEQHIYGSSRLGMRQTDLLMGGFYGGHMMAGYSYDINLDLNRDSNQSSRVLGEKNFELGNHLGNVLAVVTDKRLANNEPDVVSVTDYFPFGMPLPGRANNADSYRYGFNSQERETEITETPSHYSAEYWMYDSRLGRRWNLDPVDQTYISNYATFANNPMLFIDLDGRVVTDTNGDVVFTSNGNVQNGDWVSIGTDRGIESAQATYEEGVISADDGTQISAFRLISIQISDRGDLMANEGLQRAMGKFYKETVNAFKTNCHGTSYAQGDVWINDQDIMTLINAEYNPTNNPRPGDPCTFFFMNGNDPQVQYTPNNPDNNPVLPAHSVIMEPKYGHDPTYTSKEVYRKANIGMLFIQFKDKYYNPQFQNNFQHYTKRPANSRTQ